MKKSKKVLLSILLVALASSVLTGCGSKSKNENVPNFNSIALVDSGSLTTLSTYSYGSSIENVTSDLDLNTLSPVFSPDVFTYTVYVDSSLDDITIKATVSPEYTVFSDSCTVTQDGDSVTIKATLDKDEKTVAVFVNSESSQSTYTINFVKVETKVSPVTAEYIGSQQIALATNVEGGVIYYTTDGSDPSDNSAQYTGPILATANDLVIKAIVYKDGVAVTEVIELNYNLVDMVQVTSGTTEGVTVDKTFTLGKFPITQDQFEMVMGYNPSYFVGYSIGSNPVESVTWFDAVMYCNKLSERGGLTPYYTITNVVKNDVGNITYAEVAVNANGSKGYRLPTSTEWEYAARGGVSDIDGLYSGSNYINDVAWYGGDIDTIDIERSWTDQFITTTKSGHGGNSTYTNVSNPLDGAGTFAVGRKYPNELGIYDMSGNVWEWTETTEGNFLKVMQGGSWFNNDSNCTVSSRSNRHPSQNYSYFGFRIAKSVD